MAIISGIFALSASGNKNGSINTVTSSAEIQLGAGSLWAFSCTQDAHIRFGATGMAAADATFFRIPANQMFSLLVPRDADYIRIFNPSGSTATYTLVPMTRN